MQDANGTVLGVSLETVRSLGAHRIRVAVAELVLNREPESNGREIDTGMVITCISWGVKLIVKINVN